MNLTGEVESMTPQTLDDLNSFDQSSVRPLSKGMTNNESNEKSLLLNTGLEEISEKPKDEEDDFYAKLVLDLGD